MALVPHAHAGDTHPVDSLLTLGKESDVFIEQCMGPIKDFATLPNNSQYLLNVSPQLLLPQHFGVVQRHGLTHNITVA